MYLPYTACTAKLAAYGQGFSLPYKEPCPDDGSLKSDRRPDGPLNRDAVSSGAT